MDVHVSIPKTRKYTLTVPDSLLGFIALSGLNRIIALKFLFFLCSHLHHQNLSLLNYSNSGCCFFWSSQCGSLPWSLYLLWLFFLSHCFSTYCLGDRPLSLLGQLCLCPWRPQVCASQEPSELQHGPEAGAFPLPPSHCACSFSLWQAYQS